MLALTSPKKKGLFAQLFFSHQNLSREILAVFHVSKAPKVLVPVKNLYATTFILFIELKFYNFTVSEIKASKKCFTTLQQPKLTTTIHEWLYLEMRAWQLFSVGGKTVSCERTKYSSKMLNCSVFHIASNPLHMNDRAMERRTFKLDCELRAHCQWVLLPARWAETFHYWVTEKIIMFISSSKLGERCRGGAP